MRLTLQNPSLFKNTNSNISKMKQLIKIVFLVSIGLFLNSCYYDTLVERPVPEIPTDPDNPGYVEISFSNDIQPIFNSSCVQCHNGTVSPDLTEGNSYSSLVPSYVTPEDSNGSQLYNQVLSGHGGLSPEEIGLIKGWIDQGANLN